MNAVLWTVAAAVVAVLAAVAWWSSGRQRRGLDADGVRVLRAITESDVGMRLGNGSGG